MKLRSRFRAWLWRWQQVLARRRFMRMTELREKQKAQEKEALRRELETEAVAAGPVFPPHDCKFGWVNCENCQGSGKDQFHTGCHCYWCKGRAKTSVCAQCEMEFRWRRAASDRREDSRRRLEELNR